MITLEPDVGADDEGPTFKRRLALAVVLVTLLGAVVAYLQTFESVREDNAAGDAAREAVLGLGNQVAETADVTADEDIVTVDERLSAQEVAAQRQLERVGFDEAPAAAAAAAATQAAAARDAIAEQPALVGQTPDQVSRIDEEDDPIFARLSQAVSADEANAHGAKADTYVAVLTVLAASLFLLGLSLTVTERVRALLVVPGVALAAIAAGSTFVVSQREITTIPDAAIELTATADRLKDLALRTGSPSDMEAAIDTYSAAIGESEDFGPAFARRADAAFLVDSPQFGEADVISITDPDTAEDVIDDLERAISLGEDDEPDVLSLAGYMHAIYGDVDRGVELATQASDLRPDDPFLRFNRGAAELAADLGDEAESSYRRGLQLVDNQPLFKLVLDILSGARSDLSALVHERARDVDDDVVADINGRLASFEIGFRIDNGLSCEGCLEPGEGVDTGAEASAFEFSTDGFSSRVDFELAAVPASSPVAIVWFTRQVGADTPFQQVTFPHTVDVQVAGQGPMASVAQLRTEGCPEPAEVRVEIYAGDQFLGAAEGEIAPNRLGSELTRQVDSARGITACVPEGFIVADREDLDGRAFNTVELFNEETGVSVFAFKAIGSEEGGLSLEDRIELADRRLEGFAAGGELGPIQDTLLFGRSDDGREFLDGRIALVSGTVDQDGPTAVAVDANGVVYSVFIVGSDDMELLAAAIDLIEFTGLDAEAVPDGP